MIRKLKIDLKTLEDLEMGIYAFGFTDDPAMEKMAIALSKNKKSNLKLHTSARRRVFSSEKKMQVAGIVATTKDVYRYDDKSGSEYEIVFDYDTNKAIYNQFMKRIPTLGKKNLFNKEHVEDDLVNSYMASIMFIEGDEEIKFIKDKYKEEVEAGDIWLVAQFEDRKEYDSIVSENKLGFSLEGLFKLEDVIKEQLKKEKMTKKKLKFSKKLKFRKGSFTCNSKFSAKPFAFEADSLEKGVDVIVYDEEGNVIENWTGEIVAYDVANGEEIEVTILDDEIVNTEEAELSEDEEKEVEMESDEEKNEIKASDAKEEVEDEVKKDVEMEGEAPVDAPAEPVIESATKEDLDAVIKMIVDLQKQIDDLKGSSTEGAEMFADEDAEKKAEVEKFNRKLSDTILRNGMKKR